MQRGNLCLTHYLPSTPCLWSGVGSASICGSITTKKKRIFAQIHEALQTLLLKKTGFAVTASRRKMRMNKKHIDMTPICDKCGKTAPINEKMSTPNWTVYMVKEPCECGGQFKAKFLLEKEADHD
jgi:hypothetical protein